MLNAINSAIQSSVIAPPTTAGAARTAHGSLRPDFAVVKALDALSANYPYEAVRVVRVLFEDDRDGWAIHGWNQHLDNILKQALNDGDWRVRRRDR
jgi:hypothetical protein